MTRINVVSPILLCDQHLLAEHRELTRIPNMLLAGKYKLDEKSIANDPIHYTLGKGHCRFFLFKIGYLFDRYQELYTECNLRGFNVIRKFPPTADFLNIQNHFTHWTPSAEDTILNWNRILERLPQNPRFYGKYVCRETEVANIRSRIKNLQLAAYYRHSK